MKYLVLWSHASDYLIAQLNTLEEKGNEVHLVCHSNSSDAPFDESHFHSKISSLSISKTYSVEEILKFTNEIKPDVILVSSWHIKPYTKLLNKIDFCALRVLCMDNQWRFTFRQLLGVLLRDFFVGKKYDVAFVTGSKAAKFARFLGFRQNEILMGVYSCNTNLYFEVNPSPANREFIYVGRLVTEKGLEDLLLAYSIYRKIVDNPWTLKILGNGPDREKLFERASPGVELIGFVQPRDLPKYLGSASCLVLPSHFEQWGVVMHEAAASGLPIIWTNVCGAKEAFGVSGENGFEVRSKKPEELARALSSMSKVSSKDWYQMSSRSRDLARTNTPEVWVSKLTAFCFQFLEAKKIQGKDKY